MKKNKAILCVDDDSTVLDSLKTQLINIFSDEFIIETAESGEEALEIIEFLGRRKIDTLLIITDWLMPKMKGDELLVKVHNKFPRISKIMLSGQADERAIQNAFKNANLAAFISKPWQTEDLVAAIKPLLSDK
ncbi:response regulator [Hugenholtzia roseola]|uniref:response regulator n=1 Tax=Hugenholtzia roseola TaxID=1002 RepID=UPI000404872E|nr:response regulator [Hugenholtzia roseola]